MRRRQLAILATLPLALAGCEALQQRLGLGGPEPVRVVFFTPDSATLDEPALSVVRNAADTARRTGESVRVLGFSGPAGTPQDQVTVAANRAQAVRAALVAAGVPDGRITVGARPAVPFEAAPVESRRVEIHLVP